MARQTAKPKEPVQLTKIIIKQRSQAEQRACNHILKVGKYQCAFVEQDPMPDLPLDNVIWGNAAHLKTPTSSYSYHFQNPQSVVKSKQMNYSAVCENKLDELVISNLDVIQDQNLETTTQVSVHTI